MDNICHVIGEVHEIGSFVVHGTAAAQLLQGGTPREFEYFQTTN